MKKRITIGIVAHVDSGKTTLSEAMLYNSGKIRRLGRVDHKDSYLDNNEIERDRGITVFSKQAVFEHEDTIFTLLDTPGHADFGAEAERTLSVLDYAVLVISAPEGVQSHTRTLWQLLERYSVPTFVFINKTDISPYEKDQLMDMIKDKLSENVMDFSVGTDIEYSEDIAMCSEEMMEELLSGCISHESLCRAIKSRKLFPAVFGSALKNIGVEEIMHILSDYTIFTQSTGDFGAKVFKISYDDKGVRLTHLKVTSGSLKVKSVIDCLGETEKINEIRVYSGTKYEMISEAYAGCVCAVTGLENSAVGRNLGCEKDSLSLMLEPVFNYTVKILSPVNDAEAFEAFRKLSQEETKLSVSWNEASKQISVRLMGEIQTEVLTRVVEERFGFKVEFERASVIYKETIADTVEGVGHYEPLRHYAEVHLILSPGKRGSGITFQSKCREDFLATNWQRLILTHLAEKTHIGVLTGSPITDICITLASGKAHLKHTDGGDFRQATYRAVRHGLKNAKSVLLEPWYDAIIEIPSDNVGRVLNDISNMGGSFSPPETHGEMCIINASAPVSKIQFYQSEILSFTKGMGSMSCSLKGYMPCQNEEEVIEKIGYDSDADVENTADSVFCSHGSACIVKWNEVYDNMHLESALKAKTEEELTPITRTKNFDARLISQDEIDRIFEMTFGKADKPKQTVKNRTGDVKYKGKPVQFKEEYILVDGYNIIFAWDELKKLANKDINLARETLITRLVNYNAIKDVNLAIVFDAYKVKGGLGEVEKVNGISVIYTKEAETADSYIEKASHTLAKDYNVKVATSDSLEQIIIMGAGAMRISAKDFEKEVSLVEESIKKYISDQK